MRAFEPKGSAREARSIRTRYVLLGVLGSGGMATVYRARDRLGGVVALKSLAGAPGLDSGEDTFSPTRFPDDGQPDEPTWTADSREDAQLPSTHLQLMPRGAGMPFASLAASGAGEPRIVHASSIAAAVLPKAPAALPATVLAAGAEEERRAAYASGDGEAGTWEPRGTLDGSPASHADPATRDVRRRIALAQEFQVLASMRHPNIVSVLDYGFDDAGKPFFTMELLEGARTLLDAARDVSTEARVALLIQVLHALVYLHRRGLIHRDLKPGNVLVVGDRVKVVDFGLSLLVEQTGEFGRVIAGTPAYMAPELFQGHAPSRASDLYAFGLMAYELFAGVHPFQTQGDLWALRSEILSKQPDVSVLAPELRPLVTALLSKNPKERCTDAVEVIAALGESTGQRVAVETSATRESLLQAARLVGRDAELALLGAELDAARSGQGGAWLIGGESGVGKSRLVEEIRVRALVNGVQVLRGQEVSEGSHPHRLWGEPLRWLALLTDPDDAIASVLKPSVPDIGALLDREIPDPEDVEPEAAFLRLAEAVEQMLKSLSDPVVILLEDLHWTRSDSLRLLARVTPLLGDLPVLLLGTYRNDERSDLPVHLPAMKAIQLDRLSAAAVEQLSVSIIGPAATRPEVVDLLVRETEGNPFFLVEVVRSLAEEAGRLDRVVEAVDRPVSSKRLVQVIGRRLGLVPEHARPLLAAAAVAGRTLDLKVIESVGASMVAASGGFDIDAWLLACTGVAVLDVHDGRFRFAHDKLREGLLATLSEDERKRLHGIVALAIEAVHKDAPDQTAALAHHWDAAGRKDRAATYAGLAGEQALLGSAYQEAVALLTRALALTDVEPDASASPQGDAWISRILKVGGTLAGARAVKIDGAAFQRGRWEGMLAEAHSRLGNHTNAMRHAANALAALGVPMPGSPAQGGLGTLAEAARLAHRALSRTVKAAVSLVRPVDASAPPPSISRTDATIVLSEAADIQVRASETAYYLEQQVPMIWSGLRTINLGESAGPSAALARGYMVMAILAGILQLHPLAEVWTRRAVAMAEERGKPFDLAWVVQRAGVYRITLAAWADAERHLGRAISIAERAGDLRQWEESVCGLAHAEAYQGEFASAIDRFVALHGSAKKRGDQQIAFWGVMGQAWCHFRLGRPEVALSLLRGELPWIDTQATAWDVMNAHGLIAGAALAAGDFESSEAHARRIVSLITEKRPVAYYTQQAVSAAAEATLGLWAAAMHDPRAASGFRDLANKAVRAMVGFGRIFPMARPAAALWQGVQARMLGDTRRAIERFEQAASLASSSEMTYERALAQLEHARALRPGSVGATARFEEASRVLETIGIRLRARAADPREVGAHDVIAIDRKEHRPPRKTGAAHVAPERRRAGGA